MQLVSPRQFVIGDLCDLSRCADGSSDTVVDTFGLCVIAPQSRNVGAYVIRALNEMARVCKPDGTVD
jgi:ubiquinone/menaquinone biosynthesis C-methylase UbiE